MGTGKRSSGTELTVFDPLSFDEWMNRYKSVITVMIGWEKVKRTKPKLRVVVDGHIIPPVVLLPGPDENRVFPGFRPAVLRAPAVHWDGRYYLLDGTTRMKRVKPRMLILDYLDLRSKSQAKLFMDIVWKEFSK